MIRAFKKMTPYLFLLPFLILFANSSTCSYCGRSISGRYTILNNKHYHDTCFENYIQLSCDYCDKKISGTYTEMEGRNYHPACYQDHIQERCAQCDQLISGLYNIKDDKQYHESCFINYILPKCDICRLPIQDQYIEDFWGNIYHEKHTDALPDCDNCSRLICEPLTGGGYSINSKRYVCSVCEPSVVSDQSQIARSMRDVKALLKKVGIQDLPRGIPITMVADKDELIRLSGQRSGKIRGYTHYEAKTLGRKTISESYHIYVLSDLCEIVFDAVLAHELLHVYQIQNGYKLRSDVREGFCNLGSKLVYDHDGSDLSRLQLRTMYESDDPDYGKGFRNMSSRLDQMGWEGILNNLPSFK